MTTTQHEHADEAVALKCSANRLRDLLPDAAAHLIFWPMAVLGTMLDLWTKELAFTR